MQGWFNIRMRGLNGLKQDSQLLKRLRNRWLGAFEENRTYVWTSFSSWEKTFREISNWDSESSNTQIWTLTFIPQKKGFRQGYAAVGAPLGLLRPPCQENET